MGHGLGGVAAAGAGDVLGADGVAHRRRLLTLLEQGRLGVAQGANLDHHLVDGDRFRRQHEVEAQDLVRRDHHLGDRQGVVADHRTLDLVSAGRDIGDSEVPFDPGHCAEVGVLEKDVGADERVSRVAVDDVSGDDTGLRLPFGNSDEEKRRPEKEFAECMDRFPILPHDEVIAPRMKRWDLQLPNCKRRRWRQSYGNVTIACPQGPCGSRRTQGGLPTVPQQLAAVRGSWIRLRRKEYSSGVRERGLGGQRYSYSSTAVSPRAKR